MLRTFLMLGSINTFLAVALGAFGAHILKERLTSDMLAVFQTGVQYQMYHGLALILVAILSKQLTNDPTLRRSGWLFFIGIILFSGSLYALSLSGVKILGAITPLGGLAFLIGWFMLFWSAFKKS
ncbi:DUF423 domain-containing protein [Paenibacillus psychroresistens]|uniref:DUF423 domain-containing protein n=1 Tax=Paenibacillus psychroresistens TaxID=1778678 RepID=A0A6B8RNF3_9BACL|nr:DUF423 domain-containing protein [Paenibacillus psychroresistens]QGQ97850.1 DUF423 domain-containing protein [Paenibacillus psychroresistens]